MNAVLYWFILCAVSHVSFGEEPEAPRRPNPEKPSFPVEPVPPSSYPVEPDVPSFPAPSYPVEPINEKEDIEEPELDEVVEEPGTDIQLLEDRVTRLENLITSLQNGLQSVQVEVKSLRKQRSLVQHSTGTSGNDFDWKNGRKLFTYDWYVDNVSAFNTTYEEDDVVKSPKFYIAAKSYRMYMATYPVGRSSLPSLSLEYLGIYGGLARGAYDSLLEWPFRLRYDMCIVDQTEDNPQNIETTVIPGKTCGEEPAVGSFGSNSAYRIYFHELILDRYQEDVACGNAYLISRELLHTRNYIKNDRILFRMKVYLG